MIGLAILSALIVLLVWLLRGLSSGGSRPPSSGAGSGNAREILDIRYARGELDRDQYLQARRDLGDRAD